MFDFISKLGKNSERIKCSIYVFDKLLEVAKKQLTEREYGKILKHVAAINPGYKADELELIRLRQINREKQRKQDRSALEHYKNLVKHYRGKLVYINGGFGTRQVTIHGPAHNPSGTIRSGYIEVIDDAWFRLNKVDRNTLSSIHAYGGRIVRRPKGSFIVRILSASELCIENPYKDE